MCVISNSTADIRIFLDDCISSHGCMFFFSPSFGDFEIGSGQPYEERDSRMYFAKFPRLVVDEDYDIPLCDRHEIALRLAVVF